MINCEDCGRAMIGKGPLLLDIGLCGDCWTARGIGICTEEEREAYNKLMDAEKKGANKKKERMELANSIKARGKVA